MSVPVLHVLTVIDFRMGNHRTGRDLAAAWQQLVNKAPCCPCQAERDLFLQAKRPASPDPSSRTVHGSGTVWMVGMITVLPINVTAVCANILPSSVAPFCIAINVLSNIVPLNSDVP